MGILVLICSSLMRCGKELFFPIYWVFEFTLKLPIYPLFIVYWGFTLFIVRIIYISKWLILLFLSCSAFTLTHFSRKICWKLFASWLICFCLSQNWYMNQTTIRFNNDIFWIAATMIYSEYHLSWGKKPPLVLSV